MIACCGENLIDLVSNGDGVYQSFVGGSALNTAIAIGRLGQKAGYAMPIGNDMFGDAMIESLKASNVAYLPASRPPRPTGMAVVNVGKDGQPAYAFYRHGAADTDLQDNELPELGEDISHLHIGGSPALGHDHCGDALIRWMDSLPPELTLSLDPNVRPALIADQQRFLSRCDSVLARSAVCRLSQEDADYMYGTDDAKEVAYLLFDKGVELAVVTLGPDGAFLANSSASAQVEVIKGNIKDTVAAGDTFMAALLAQLTMQGVLNNDEIVDLDSEQLAQFGRFAAAASAINCSRNGCNPPTLAEVEQLLANKP